MNLLGGDQRGRATLDCGDEAVQAHHVDIPQSHLTVCSGEAGYSVGELQKLLTFSQVADALITHSDLRLLFKQVALSLRTVLGIEYSDLLLADQGTETLQRVAVSSFQKSRYIKEGYKHSYYIAPEGRVVMSGKTFLASADQNLNEVTRCFLAEGLHAICSVPLVYQGQVLGTLGTASASVEKFTPDCIAFLQKVGKLIALAVMNNRTAFRSTEAVVHAVGAYAVDELNGLGEQTFEGIVGGSAALQSVLEQVKAVADTDASVLILGETGTGKELIARALHRLSTRKSHTFVRLNCAAVPLSLLESELFGYEKGAFTGAFIAKQGRIEIANRGTLFLDEVGDLALELQPKLLSVLQEREFVRVGGTRPLHADVRVIAATNRNLEEMIEQGSFRRDLFYRLNVIPIEIPPLRERREDIPLLVRHFVRKYSAARNREIKVIPSDFMSQLIQQRWPGNIRELENVIERAVVLSKNDTLSLSFDGQKRTAQPARVAPTLPEPEAVRRHRRTPVEDAKQREIIVEALEYAHGIVGGPSGAAAFLGLKRTTLINRMRALGISMKRSCC